MLNEIVFYQSEEELRDKINFYTKNRQQREEIILKARKRVLSDHLLKHRLQEMLMKSKNLFSA